MRRRNGLVKCKHACDAGERAWRLQVDTGQDEAADRVDHILRLIQSGGGGG